MLNALILTGVLLVQPLNAELNSGILAISVQGPLPAMPRSPELGLPGLPPFPRPYVNPLPSKHGNSIANSFAMPEMPGIQWPPFLMSPSASTIFLHGATPSSPFLDCLDYTYRIPMDFFTSYRCCGRNLYFWETQSCEKHSASPNGSPVIAPSPFSWQLTCNGVVYYIAMAYKDSYGCCNSLLFNIDTDQCNKTERTTTTTTAPEKSVPVLQPRIIVPVVNIFNYPQMAPDPAPAPTISTTTPTPGSGLFMPVVIIMDPQTPATTTTPPATVLPLRDQQVLVPIVLVVIPPPPPPEPQTTTTPCYRSTTSQQPPLKLVAVPVQVPAPTVLRMSSIRCRNMNYGIPADQVRYYACCGANIFDWRIQFCVLNGDESIDTAEIDGGELVQLF